MMQYNSLWSCWQGLPNRKKSERMRYSSQIRAARALLGWSQADLARIAGIGLATLQRIEQTEGVVRGNFSTALKIQTALQEAGIVFTDNEAGEIGVHLRTKRGATNAQLKKQKSKIHRGS